MANRPDQALNHTGNRVGLAVVVGLAASAFISTASVHGTARGVAFLVVAGLTYALVTLLHSSRR
ncbi:hypothetical protein [Micromonospora chersina]|uniref:hypothetical protein n=1 Tax=Micromonospora chersina TaxID=47854 RepID=UPI0033C68B65